MHKCNAKKPKDSLIFFDCLDVSIILLIDVLQ